MLKVLMNEFSLPEPSPVDSDSIFKLAEGYKALLIAKYGYPLDQSHRASLIEAADDLLLDPVLSQDKRWSDAMGDPEPDQQDVLSLNNSAAEIMSALVTGGYVPPEAITSAANIVRQRHNALSAQRALAALAVSPAKAS